MHSESTLSPFSVENAPPLEGSSWDGVWRSLGGSAPPGAWEALLARYREPHRAYHTAEHLCECLTLLAAHRDACDHPAEVALALWYHDAIYDTTRADNEARSAALLTEQARTGGVPATTVSRMAALVLDTVHAAVPIGHDAALLVDIDLAILGASPARFARYDRDIREEYRWVPAEHYRAGRAAVLGQFLARQPLYATSVMRDRFEASARVNVATALRHLELFSSRRPGP